ncbi:MAG: ATP-dependent zinc metalloprotease FtsH, partial [Clostridia bacterium]|nr:ATP-dependent zinc metalloprotease FtsH [Clostridia bacterium]
DVTTGASSDIKRATEIAREMVTEYGMSEKIGPVFLGTEQEVFLGKSFSQQNSGFSEKVSEMIDAEVHDLLTEAYKRAEDILKEHRDQLDDLASLLIEREKLNAEEFECFMSGKELPEPEIPAAAEPIAEETLPEEAEAPAPEAEEQEAAEDEETSEN